MDADGPPPLHDGPPARSWSTCAIGTKGDEKELGDSLCLKHNGKSTAKVGQRKFDPSGWVCYTARTPALACDRPGHCNETRPGGVIHRERRHGRPNDRRRTAPGRQALVDRARTDPEAFGMLYERYVKRIYNYVYFRTGSHEDTKDHLACLPASGSAAEYVYRPRSALCRLAVPDRPQRCRQLVPRWPAADGAARYGAIACASGGQHQIETNAERDQVLAALRKLTAERQQLLILKFIDQMSNAEIGQVLKSKRKRDQEPIPSNARGTARRPRRCDDRNQPAT